MKPTRSRDEDNRRRHPVPWPRSVEIKAVLVVALAFLAGFYYLSGGVSRDARWIVSLLRFEDSYVRHCKGGLAYYLKTYENQRLGRLEIYQDAGPHDVHLVYDAQNPSGSMVRGGFRCLYVPGSGRSSSVRPQLRDVELYGARLTVNERLMLEANILNAIDRNR